jgi:hypothetical protein
MDRPTTPLSVTAVRVPEADPGAVGEKFTVTVMVSPGFR